MKTINHHTTLMIGLLLFITTSSASSAVVDKNNRKSFEEVAANAAAFLRTKTYDRPVRRATDIADLPYFAGREGELCRRNLIQEWEETAEASQVGRYTVKFQALQDIMASDRYKEARSRCFAEMEIYDRVSAVVCSLESEGKYNITYNEAWGGGPYYMDGQYDLATMFMYTGNFTTLSLLDSCFADCYIGLGDGCAGLEVWLPHVGDVSTEQYCSLKWSGIDEAYMALKVCAAKAIGGTDPSSKEEQVGLYQKQQWEQSKCAYDYCQTRKSPL